MSATCSVVSEMIAALRTVKIVDLEVEVGRKVFWYRVRIHINPNHLTSSTISNNTINSWRSPRQRPTIYRSDAKRQIRAESRAEVFIFVTARQLSSRGVPDLSLRFIITELSTTEAILSQFRSTHLAFWVLFGDLYGPTTGAEPAFQDATRARDGRKYEPVVEHHVENFVHILQPIDLILLVEQTLSDYRSLTEPSLLHRRLEQSILRSPGHTAGILCCHERRLPGTCCRLGRSVNRYIRLSKGLDIDVGLDFRKRTTHPSFMVALDGICRA